MIIIKNNKQLQAHKRNIFTITIKLYIKIVIIITYVIKSKQNDTYMYTSFNFFVKINK